VPPDALSEGVLDAAMLHADLGTSCRPRPLSVRREARALMPLDGHFAPDNTNGALARQTPRG
jgi:hypothetical protein